MRQRTKDLIQTIIILFFIILILIFATLIAIKEMNNSISLGLAVNATGNSYSELAERFRSMDSTQAYFIILCIVGFCVLLVGVALTLFENVKNKRDSLEL